MAVESPNYSDFVVVAEEEWKMHSDRREANVKFSAHLGGLEWECTFKNHDSLCLECRELSEGSVANVHLELLVYHRLSDSANYTMATECPQRCHLVHAQCAAWTYTIPSNYYPNVLLTIRILKDRSSFPDFAVPNNKFGHLISNARLRIANGQIFHVNKQLLAWLSVYFDRLFNGNFSESKQDEVKLKDESADSAIFQDFLLCISPPGKDNVLPNSKNVEGLLRLATYYQVDWVLEKCERHLKLCREISTGERILLAKKFGLKDLQARIVNEVLSLEECKRLCFLILGAEDNGIATDNA